MAIYDIGFLIGGVFNIKPDLRLYALSSSLIGVLLILIDAHILSAIIDYQTFFICFIRLA